jgi:hypothetical protein
LLSDDVGETYELQTVNENLQETNKKCAWLALFRAGVEKLEFEALEDALKTSPLRVPPNTRFDYTFYSPTGHQIRFKVMAASSILISV